MSQSAAARTARLDPSLIAITISRPRRISTTVWVTAPPSNTRAAPWVRLVSPDVTAASWSTRSAGNPCENAIGSPSDETTIECATDGTRSTKFVISQFRSCTGRTSGLTRAPSFRDRPAVLPLASLQALACRPAPAQLWQRPQHDRLDGVGPRLTCHLHPLDPWSPHRAGRRGLP